MTPIDLVLEQLGFRKARVVLDRKSVATVFPKQRQGIYVLHLSNGKYYVGLTNNIARRFLQHRERFSIERISFIPVCSRYLRERECHVLRLLMNSNFEVENILLLTTRSIRPRAARMGKYRQTELEFVRA